jgi:hypothetical protein
MDEVVKAELYSIAKAMGLKPAVYARSLIIRGMRADAKRRSK